MTFLSSSTPPASPTRLDSSLQTPVQTATREPTFLSPLQSYDTPYRPPQGIGLGLGSPTRPDRPPLAKKTSRLTLAAQYDESEAALVFASQTARLKSTSIDETPSKARPRKSLPFAVPRSNCKVSIKEHAESNAYNLLGLVAMSIAIVLLYRHQHPLVNAPGHSSDTMTLAQELSLERPWRSLAVIYEHLPKAFSWSAYVGASNDPLAIHPILPLLRDSQARWTRMTRAQSRSLAAATATYRARYGLPPPPGFAAWYAFAQSRQHRLVDEYDSLMRDLKPFRSLPPSVLRERIQTLGQLRGISLVHVKAGKISLESRSGLYAPAQAIRDMMKPYQKNLPDLIFAVNEKTEGRILPRVWAPEERLRHDPTPARNATVLIRDPLADEIHANGFKSEWKGEGSVWSTFQRACPPHSNARRLIKALRSDESAQTHAGAAPRRATGYPFVGRGQQSTNSSLPPVSRRRNTAQVDSARASQSLPQPRELTFNTQLDSQLDLCNKPTLHALSSAWFSDTRSISHLYPLFSPAKPTGFADILIPGIYHWSPPSEYEYEWEFKHGRSSAPMDVDWSQKDAKIFWRGKITHGADSPIGHSASFQKQRLASLANDDGGNRIGGKTIVRGRKSSVPAHLQSMRAIVIFNASDSSLASVSAPSWLINSETLDVAMACDFALDHHACREQRLHGFKIAQPGPLSDAWQHKYVLDLDEVGHSPRFLAFMESKSAVVKSTIQREFWSDWVVPWHHFIPLSSAFAELFNIHSFFTGLPDDMHDNDRVSQPTTLLAPSRRLDASTLKQKRVTSDGSFSGDEALRTIGARGSAWRTQHARRDDMEVSSATTCCF
ncbi:glycosyltransferase family 90 protein [Mixia osmundae IAM 14324]|uniref:glycosyltransferase family 90 protein n=1 Tax=Mixia osmundae (strain CBS 9802 / IAM 14324 / JCM 22182 / KY 12970) TaxID=764103 RepID=UPI0004A548DD|nr:glycosyltransferase family 90 protein [Mixia osmundae IAM 14324]KEI40938.1 glycosyltransferase family 90 protein [Mixia osmundae IAM 14324]